MNIIAKTMCTAFALLSLLGVAGIASAAQPAGQLAAGVTGSIIEADETNAVDVTDVTDVTDDSRFDAAVELDGQLNINTASAEQWEMLPGVGPAIAARIVTYRDKYPFKQINHIMRVKGIGKKTYAKIKPFLSLEGDSTLEIVG